MKSAPTLKVNGCLLKRFFYTKCGKVTIGIMTLEMSAINLEK